MARTTGQTDQATDTATTKKRGTPPSHILLNALYGALNEPGVERAEIALVVKFARSARGVNQAPMWKSLAKMLDDAVKVARGEEVEDTDDDETDDDE